MLAWAERNGVNPGVGTHAGWGPVAWRKTLRDAADELRARIAGAMAGRADGLDLFSGFFAGLNLGAAQLAYVAARPELFDAAIVAAMGEAGAEEKRTLRELTGAANQTARDELAGLAVGPLLGGASRIFGRVAAWARRLKLPEIPRPPRRAPDVPGPARTPEVPAAAKQAESSGAAFTPNNAAHNAADFARHKDHLRAEMGRPHVNDAELAGLMDELYRPDARIGSGSSAAALRHELATGSTVGGRRHLQKAQDMITALQKGLRRNGTAPPGDRAAAENTIRDLQNALDGN
jgi:hypothetical protein